MMHRMLLSFCLIVLLGISPVRAEEPVQAEEKAQEDLSGRWLLLQRSTTVAKVPVIGSIQATSRVLSLHDLNHHKSRLKGAGRVCNLEVDSGTSLVDTILPEAFRRSLPPPKVDARLVMKEGELHFKQGRQVIVVGAKLKNVQRDKMPTKASDPRVFDQDGDGHPGVTIRISGLVSGDIYVAQRTWTQLSGKRDGVDAFTGRLFFGNEQHILGTTSSRLENAPNPRPVPSRSHFRLQRVPNDMSCAAAKALAKNWFR